MKRTFCIIISLLSIGRAFAVDCPAEEIEHLQPQIDSILFKQKNQGWHKLGDPSHPGVRAMYTAMLAAQMAGRKVTVRYAEPFDCKAYDLSSSALMVRTQN